MLYVLIILLVFVSQLENPLENDPLVRGQFTQEFPEAALKSDFNMNVSAGSKHPGTITYTFTGK